MRIAVTAVKWILSYLNDKMPSLVKRNMLLKHVTVTLLSVHKMKQITRFPKECEIWMRQISSFVKMTNSMSIANSHWFNQSWKDTVKLLKAMSKILPGNRLNYHTGYFHVGIYFVQQVLHQRFEIHNGLLNSYRPFL